MDLAFVFAVLVILVMMYVIWSSDSAAGRAPALVAGILPVGNSTQIAVPPSSAIPAPATIKLVKKTSKSPCLEGSSFGLDTTNNRFMWVSDGCAGEFEVSGSGPITCASERYVRKTCPLTAPQTASNVNAVMTSNVNATTASSVDTVTVKKQNSKAACVNGTSFGIDPTNRFVWVDRGCNAEFLIQPSGKTVKCGASSFVYKTCPY